MWPDVDKRNDAVCTEIVRSRLGSDSFGTGPLVNRAQILFFFWKGGGGGGWRGGREHTSVNFSFR